MTIGVHIMSKYEVLELRLNNVFVHDTNVSSRAPRFFYLMPSISERSRDPSLLLVVMLHIGIVNRVRLNLIRVLQRSQLEAEPDPTLLNSDRYFRFSGESSFEDCLKLWDIYLDFNRCYRKIGRESGREMKLYR